MNGMMTQDSVEKALKLLIEGKDLKAEVDGRDVRVERVDSNAIQLPRGMSIDAGIEWLRRRKTTEEQVVGISAVIPGFPADGLSAFHRVLGRVYGWSEAVPTPGFFGDTPPQMVSVQVGETKTVQLPFGRIQVPGIEGHIDLTLQWGSLAIQASVKSKHSEAIKALYEMVKKSAQDESIYKGQAVKTSVNGATQPKFLQLGGIDPTDLILPRDVEAAIQVSLFTPITRADECKEWGVPLKRGVLLNGPFGTGKSFTAMVTAKLAVKHGWTFIYLEDINKLTEAVSLARHYAPAVLFAEDLDRVVTGERDLSMDAVLNTLDGIEGKADPVIVVFTTNDVDAINPAMLRPGRLDAVVDVKAPDAEAAERLLRKYSRGLADADASFGEAAELVQGMVPAAIREVVERAKLAAISNGHNEIQDDDLKTAALAMKNQVALFTRAQPQDTAFERIADGIEDAALGIEALRLIQSGHVTLYGARNCGNPGCPIHGGKA